MQQTTPRAAVALQENLMENFKRLKQSSGEARQKSNVLLDCHLVDQDFAHRGSKKYYCANWVLKNAFLQISRIKMRKMMSIINQFVKLYMLCSWNTDAFFSALKNASVKNIKFADVRCIADIHSPEIDRNMLNMCNTTHQVNLGKRMNMNIE